MRVYVKRFCTFVFALFMVSEVNVNEYMRANCEYPGEWTGELERTEKAGDMIVTVAHVYPKDRSWSLHVTSFFKLEDSKIKSIDEYWAEDGEAPEWRKNMNIGKPIL